MIHAFVGGVTGWVGFTPSISVVVVVKVIGLCSDEDDEAESDDCDLHYSNGLIILLNSGHYSTSTTSDTDTWGKDKRKSAERKLSLCSFSDLLQTQYNSNLIISFFSLSEIEKAPPS